MLSLISISDQTYHSFGAYIYNITKWIFDSLWKLVNELMPRAFHSYFSPKVAINQNMNHIFFYSIKYIYGIELKPNNYINHWIYKINVQKTCYFH